MSFGTPSGALPEGWKQNKLETLLAVSIGGIWGEESGLSEVDVDVVRVTELKAHGFIEPSTAAKRSITRKQFQSRALEVGDLLLEKSGGGPNTPVGRVGYVLSIDKPMVCSNFMQLMRPDAKKVLPTYLHFFLTFLHSNGETIPMQTSTTNIRNIKTPEYMAVVVPVPSLPEQEKIVEILEVQLSRLDASLASVRAVRKKSARFRRSLLHEAFTGALSGRGSGTDAVHPGWKKVPLIECGHWFGGGTPSKSNKKFWDDGTIPWLSPKDMGEFRLRDTQDKITKKAVEESSTKLIPGPSVAVVMRSGILERTFPVALVDFDTTLNQDMKAIVPNSTVSALWIAYALKAFEQELLDTCRKSGTTVASMETVRLLNFKIPLPEKQEQLLIVEILEEQLSRLNASLAIADVIEKKALALRRSLLHAAFSGNLTKEWREGAHV